MFLIKFLIFAVLSYSAEAAEETTLVVSPVYTTTDTCLSESSASGPITSNLNTAITGGKFTFYGISGRGACGLDIDTPTMSAAASGSLFNSSASWVASCMSDGRYLLNDPICMNKCVKIQYNGKSLTVPINNKCSECELNHVDLSSAAFLWLEPAGGTVGVATGATITYLECA
ncbi:hypothetical protein niasHT_032182 [Heterodera trifolii]|uniref:Expansin n=1 Tax=Heterodera trifolii TaxID=157864 RepID=A0ABD2HUX8_9BILA